MHKEAYQWIKEQAALIAWPGQHVLEIGSYNVNGSVRALFPETQYVGIDRRPGRDVDIVCDARDVDYEGSYDIVVSTEVLEHEVEPEAIIACAWRALRPGGVLLLTIASPERAPHGCDGGPVGTEHYAGIAPRALHKMLHDWDGVVIEHYRERGDVYARATRV